MYLVRFRRGTDARLVRKGVVRMQGGELRWSGIAAEGLRRWFVALALATVVVVEIIGAPGPGAGRRRQHQGCDGGCPHADTLRCHSAAHLSTAAYHVTH